MLIPVRCFSCNQILGDKFFKLKELHEKNTPWLEIFKKLNIENICCKTIIKTCQI